MTTYYDGFKDQTFVHASVAGSVERGERLTICGLRDFDFRFSTSAQSLAGWGEGTPPACPACLRVIPEGTAECPRCHGPNDHGDECVAYYASKRA